MKKQRFLSVVTICIALVLIVSGYLIIFVNDYTVDAQEKENYASLIKNSFISYFSDIEDISYEIKGITIFDIKYYGEIKTNYNTSVNNLDSIGLKINELEETTTSLIYQCEVREYNDYDIDYKCESIKYNYESIVNAYISLIEKYNNKISEYNTWIEQQNKNLNNSLAYYESSYYSDYVDINEDGVYSGKIE